MRFVQRYPQHLHNTSRSRFLSAAFSLIVASLATAGIGMAAHASEWPEQGRPVRFIVGYSPGGGTDVLSRLVAEQLSAALGTPFLVENKPGAGGTVAANLVSKAPPDGYTLLFASDPELTIAPVILESMQYDPFTDLQPISQVARGPYVVVARPGFPPSSLSELVEYVKANPGAANFGSSGTGTSSHLLGEQLNSEAGIQVTHVPYKGMSATVSDLVAGHIDYAFVPPLVARSFIDAGNLKALAMAAPDRVKGMEGVPTTTESGFPELVGGAWYALMAPAGLDRRVITRLQAAVEEVVSSSGSRAAIERLALVPRSSSSEELSALMRQENKKWQTLAGTLGL
ncbi:hypothetical protein CR155_03635 [Pollutimonas nitritireducens]|uniref:Uncharacterized protein n=1 Tax=Pollutimonas nitritireducens TaxID=2045209 RepID=A0A2N4UJV7_9BURK|nr:tripartite tricarboxylate transporter substrate binding protein [Pollutimonas nitritireducens]PLC55306.1 hypothetical protein CR155_03635 [Pollutimonas nitritireducens]